MSYLCPLCHQTLAFTERTFRCENNHAFDLAKEGYVNLMPVHHKRSKDPGDSKEMMQARRRFLEKGHYQPMQQRVAELCAQDIESGEFTLLDIGCGEGYYTNEVAQHVTAKSPNAQIYGLDIAKIAIRFAAKRYDNCQFSVASSHRLPFATQSLNTILRIYAPCKAEELERCIKEDGLVITVTPAGRHLYQLKERIYQDVQLHSEEPETIEGFSLVHQEQLNYMMDLTDGDGFDLLQMTPFAWKASDELREQLKSATLFQCEADFMLRVYQKNAAN